MSKGPEKKIDVKQVLKYLNRSFQNALESRPRAERVDGRPNKTYQLQADFAYLLDEIQRGPECLMTHNIAKANELIDSVAKAE